LILERPTQRSFAFAQDDKAFIVIPNKPFMFVVPNERSDRGISGLPLFVILRPVSWPKDLGFDSGETHPRDPSHSLGMTKAERPALERIGVKCQHIVDKKMCHHIVDWYSFSL